MTQTIFAPKLTQSDTDAPVAAQAHQTPSAGKDTTSQWLLSLAHWLLIGFAGLLPVFFLPGLWGSLGFQKVLLAMGVIGGVVVLLSLLSLRTKSVVSIVPVSLMLFWGVVGAAAVSALFSPDWLGAFRGSAVESQTVAFLFLLAAVMTVMLTLQRAKKATFTLLAALAVGGLGLLVYVVIRLIFGPILAFGSFQAVTVSPLGNFNDLAVFAGLTIVLALIALLQLRVTAVVRGVLVALVALSLIVLAAVNFFYVWLVIGFFSLLVLLYLIAQDTLFSSASVESEAPAPKKPVSKLTLGLTAAVCVVSAGFIVTGDYLGGVVSSTFSIDYLEVRPSLGATVDILQSTYQEDLLFGAGPNQFLSSWRQFKDASINQTIFWNTDFRSGSGYIPTMFVNVGLIGLLLVILFHAWYLWAGVRMLLRPAVSDSFWYFVALLSFTGAVFLWGISYVYVPGQTLLLLTAVLTGLSLAAGGVLHPQRLFRIPLASSQQRGFALMAVAIVFISSAMGAWFTFGKQYVAQASFAQAQATETEAAAIDQAALSSYSLFPDDLFLGVRARLALFEMNQILTISEPTEADQQRFAAAFNQALTFASAGVEQAPTEPAYQAILAGVYNNLAIAGVEDAAQRATSSIAAAQALDPKNPTYAFLAAQLAVSRGDLVASRASLLEALQQKNNFTQALFLLAQVDIAEGNEEAAIATTQAIIRLEPNNPARYYQLGILQASVGNAQAAKQAYQQALQIDNDFANARYQLALLQVADNEIEAAISGLLFIQVSNPDNEQLASLITTLESGEIPELPSTNDEPVNENEPVVVDDEVTSTEVPDSDLLTPLNTVSSDNSALVEEGANDDSFSSEENVQAGSDQAVSDEESQDTVE